jgi:hypothetical protein
MQEIIPSPLTSWESFYVIAGSAAAALTGLQFVVMALVTETQASGDMATINAYATPTIVHFCMVLLISAIMSAPWTALSSVAIALGVTGLIGVGYVTIVTKRAGRTRDYTPVFEDWLWHVVLPMVAYVAVLITAMVLPSRTSVSLFLIAAAALLLLFIGIHNAWDTVTYIAIEKPGVKAGDEKS